MEVLIEVFLYITPLPYIIVRHQINEDIPLPRLYGASLGVEMEHGGIITPGGMEWSVQC